MIMTSDNLVRDLREIDHLIVALSTPDGVDDDDFEDLRWLEERRRFLWALLAVRRQQRNEKIVSLEVWRYGRETVQPRRRSRMRTGCEKMTVRSRCNCAADRRLENTTGPTVPSF